MKISANAKAVNAASGAVEILNQLQIFPDLAAATADLHHTLATTARARELSQQREHLFSLEIDPHLRLRGSRTELYSAFSNLIFNAVHYTPERGVIRIRWYGDEAGAHFEVEDLDAIAAAPTVANVLPPQPELPEVVGETPTELKLTVTYVYGIPDGFVVEEGDPLMPMGEDCSGEATRDFTLAKTPTGLHVLTMTGPMHP